MNSVNFKTVKLFTRISFLLLIATTAQSWDVDMSRRKVDFDRVTDQNRLPASTPARNESRTFPVASSGFALDEIIPSHLPGQDIVILNTDKGFVPEKVVVRKGEVYKIHLVNVHSEKKNISFILDDFAESHSTPFAKQKLFDLKPKKSGEFTFHCPETSFRGRLIVIDGDRKPASK